jgi:hypothetical protein
VSEWAQAEMSILPTTILLTTAGSIEAELATTMVVNEQLLGPRLKMPRVPLRARESSLTPLNCGRRVRLCVWKVFGRDLIGV